MRPVASYFLHAQYFYFPVMDGAKQPLISFWVLKCIVEVYAPYPYMVIIPWT
jgi:hypothetical protein